MSLEKIQKLLLENGQSHLLAFWDQLSQSQKKSILEQIRKLDFSEINRWIRDLIIAGASSELPRDLAPAPFYPAQPTNAQQQRKYTEAVELGKELISTGKVAAFVVAGGQGTRLGFDGPKGNFPISPVMNKTFFQIFAETIAVTGRRYGTFCPWYIMTSPLNHTETIGIFRANEYYGLDKRNVFIFQQGTLPNFNFDGKILLADKAKISCSPDGHGGSIRALYNSGAIDDMKKRGVEFISYWQIDNSLINIFDPLFIGLHVLDGSEMSSKALTKAEPKEKVGNFCLVNDKVTVIEYTEFNELPDEIVNKKTDDGSLAFRLGSIAIHIISTSFVERLNAYGFSLPLHRAEKKIPYIDKNGNHVEPAEPSGVKLETFVFDALPLAEKSIILETIREQEFAPTKQLTGVDSVETARGLIVARAIDWLESAGIRIPRKPNGGTDCLVEIAPSFALYKEDVKMKRDQIPHIKPGDKTYLT